MFTIISTGLLGIASLFIGAFEKPKLLIPTLVIGLLAIIGLNFFVEVRLDTLASMLDFNAFSLNVITVLLSLAVVLFLLAQHHFKNESFHMGDIYGLVLFSMCGAFMLTAYKNLSLLFIGVETLSIPLYILAGSRRLYKDSNEASIKYFIMGAFASAIMLFGIALIFTATSSLQVDAIQTLLNTENTPNLLRVGILLTLIGFLFKIGAAPFHFWVPDVYQGAPIWVTAYMSTLVKIGGLIGFYQFISHISTANGTSHFWDNALWIVVLAGFIIANFSATQQTESKRLLAYSSVAHASFMVLPLLVNTPETPSILLYYSLVYGLSNLLLFGVIMALANTENGLKVSAFKGLIKNNPFLTLVTTIGLLSLAGIPPFAGFFAKYFVLAQAMASNLNILVLAGIAGSLIGVYYYFKLLIPMFDTSDSPAPKVELSFLFQFTLGLLALALLVLGIFPSLILG